MTGTHEASSRAGAVALSAGNAVAGSLAWRRRGRARGAGSLRRQSQVRAGTSGCSTWTGRARDVGRVAIAGGPADRSPDADPVSGAYKSGGVTGARRKAGAHGPAPPAGSSRPYARPGRRGAFLLRFLAVLALLSGMFAAAPAAADVLVSNIGQPGASSRDFLGVTHAQRFTTGSHAAGYYPREHRIGHERDRESERTSERTDDRGGTVVRSYRGGSRNQQASKS